MQIRNSFDHDTIKKLKKAVWIAFQYALANIVLALLKEIGAMDLGEFTPFVSAILPLVVETVRQWRKGVSPEEKTEEEITE